MLIAKGKPMQNTLEIRLCVKNISNYDNSKKKSIDINLNVFTFHRIAIFLVYIDLYLCKRVLCIYFFRELV